MAGKTVILALTAMLLAGCGALSNRADGQGIAGTGMDWAGIRAEYIRLRGTSSAKGGEIVLTSKAGGNESFDIGYGAYEMAFDKHKNVSNGDCKDTVFNVTYRYYLSGGASGFYLGGGFTQSKFSYRIDPETRAAIETANGLPANTYRERLGDATKAHFEMGLDFPIGQSMCLGFGARQANLSTKVKKIFDATVENETADLKPTLWFLQLIFTF
jgi:hypothetical protein